MSRYPQVAVRPRVVIVITVALVAAACSNPRDGKAPAASSPKQEVATEASPVTTVVAPLVGEWARTLQCSELAAAYAEAGLQDYMRDMVWGSFFWPQVRSAEALDFDPKDPCRGAKPRIHSHYFTDMGTFGSRDENGEEVDFGTYEIVRENRVMINDVLFRYRVRGDAITFDPVAPDCTPCFEHAWGVSVASPGGEWNRVG